MLGLHGSSSRRTEAATATAPGRIELPGPLGLFRAASAMFPPWDLFIPLRLLISVSGTRKCDLRICPEQFGVLTVKDTGRQLILIDDIH